MAFLKSMEKVSIGAYVAMLRKAPVGTKRNQVMRAMHGMNVAAYKASGGKLGGIVGGMPVLLLETIGRKSRKRRTVPVLYVTEGDSYVIVGSRAGSDHAPAWYHNLREQSETLIHVGKERKYVAIREAQGAERDELFERMKASYDGFADYERRAGQTGRVIPVIVLSPK